MARIREFFSVIPAKAGIRKKTNHHKSFLDSRFRGNDPPAMLCTRLQRPASSVKRSFSGWCSSFGQVALRAGNQSSYPCDPWPMLGQAVVKNVFGYAILSSHEKNEI